MAEQQSSLIRRTLRRALAASGITAAALYTWWQAVEGARTPTVLPETSTGATLTLGRFELTPLSLQLRPSSSSSAAGKQMVVLSAKVENITGQTQSALLGYPPRLVTIEAGDTAFGVPEVTLLRDHQPLRQLQPRMPEEVEIAWHTPENWQAEELSLTFYRQQFKLKDNLYSRSNWLGYSAVARMAAMPEPSP